MGSQNLSLDIAMEYIYTGIKTAQSLDWFIYSIPLSSTRPCIMCDTVSKSLTRTAVCEISFYFRTSSLSIDAALCCRSFKMFLVIPNYNLHPGRSRVASQHLLTVKTN